MHILKWLKLKADHPHELISQKYAWFLVFSLRNWKFSPNVKRIHWNWPPSWTLSFFIFISMHFEILGTYKIDIEGKLKVLYKRTLNHALCNITLWNVFFFFDNSIVTTRRERGGGGGVGGGGWGWTLDVLEKPGNANQLSY